MKKLFGLLLVFLITNVVFSQNGISVREEAKKITDQLVLQYKLDANQEVKMQAIQERKIQNEKDFAFYEASEEKMQYSEKKANLEGTKFSVERLLKSDQMKIYKKDQENARLRNFSKIKELQSAGLKGFELEKAILDLEQLKKNTKFAPG